MDNTAADNAVSGGVLALTAVTGPMPVIGGTVNGGTITTSGSADVQVVATATIPAGPVGYDFFFRAGFYFLVSRVAAGGWLPLMT